MNRAQAKGDIRKSRGGFLTLAQIAVLGNRSGKPMRQLEYGMVGSLRQASRRMYWRLIQERVLNSEPQTANGEPFRTRQGSNLQPYDPKSYCKDRIAGMKQFVLDIGKK